MKHSFRMSLTLVLLFVLVSGLLACGSGIYLRPAPSSIRRAYPISAADRYTSYWAFGDSITAGYGLDSSRQSYPYVIAMNRSLNLQNFAIFAEQACDLSSHQIFPNWKDPAIKSGRLYSVLIGTNDVGQKGPGAYEAIFRECHLAAVSWLAIPSESKLRPATAGIATQGQTTRDLFYGEPAVSTRSSGSEIRFSVNASKRSALYIWTAIDDASSGTYDYLLDGTTMGSRRVRPDVAIATFNGTTRSLGVLRIPIAQGQHTVQLIQTSQGSEGVTFLGAGVTDFSSPPDTVLVGTVPYQLFMRGEGPCNYTEKPCLNYIADIQNNVSQLQADGMDVRLFDTREFMLGNPSEMYDYIHPNALGNLHISQSVEESF